MGVIYHSDTDMGLTNESDIADAMVAEIRKELGKEVCHRRKYWWHYPLFTFTSIFCRLTGVSMCRFYKIVVVVLNWGVSLKCRRKNDTS